MYAMCIKIILHDECDDKYRNKKKNRKDISRTPSDALHLDVPPPEEGEERAPTMIGALLV